MRNMIKDQFPFEWQKEKEIPLWIFENSIQVASTTSFQVNDKPVKRIEEILLIELRIFKSLQSLFYRSSYTIKKG